MGLSAQGVPESVKLHMKVRLGEMNGIGRPVPVSGVESQTKEK